MADKITKKSFVEMYAKKFKMSAKGSKETIESVLDLLHETILLGEVSLPELGTFTVAERSARMSRNPRTGEKIEVAAKKAVTFKPCKQLKDKING